MASKIIKYIENLDYPKDKLDVKLLIEEDDTETINSLNETYIPTYFKIIIIPFSYPRTKPKALNYALSISRGKFIAIYDAEDRPDSSQLKTAIKKFEKLGPEYICVQARLNYYNANENILTKCFSIEYSIWFEYVLPALYSLKLFIPLGGTSNHFKLEKLLEIGGWDSYNVTEDADLAIRLYRNNYKIALIKSETLEQSVNNLRGWLKQRSRWIKGYMQTYLVHMRSPLKLYKEMGAKNFWFFQLMFGLQNLHNLAVPICISICVTNNSYLFPNITLKFFMLYIISSNWLAGVIMFGSKRIHNIFFPLFIIPIYFMLNHIAAYIALYELIKKPHFWAKTKHY